MNVFKKFVAAVTVIFMAVTVCGEASDLKVVKSYYLLKYEYEKFLTPLVDCGVTDSQFEIFFREVEDELREIDGINRENFDKYFSSVVTRVAVRRENVDIALAVTDVYGDEIESYKKTHIIPDSLQEVYEAVLRALFEENEIDKSNLVVKYENYRDIYNKGLIGYTSESVQKLRSALETALGLLRNKAAIQSDIDEAVQLLDNAYEGLVMSNEPGSGGSGGGSGGSGGGSGGSGGGSGGSVSAGSAGNTAGTEGSSDNQTVQFVDVGKSFWGYSAITYLAEKKIITGYEDSTYRPNEGVTREQIAAILCRAFNLNTGTSQKTFRDVDENLWFAPYVEAVAQNGIMQGFGDGVFGVGQKLTREDFAVIAYRIIKNDSEVLSEQNGEAFGDMDAVSVYAKDSVMAMKRIGIIKGMGNNLFAPKNNVTRAEAAQIIFGLLNK